MSGKETNIVLQEAREMNPKMHGMEGKMEVLLKEVTLDLFIAGPYGAITTRDIIHAATQSLNKEVFPINQLIEKVEVASSNFGWSDRRNSIINPESRISLKVTGEFKGKDIVKWADVYYLIYRGVEKIEFHPVIADEPELAADNPEAEINPTEQLRKAQPDQPLP